MTQNSIFVGAYVGDKCIGLAILQHHFLKYMHLYDLKVNYDYRRKDVGKMLIEKSKEIASKHGYREIYTRGRIITSVLACSTIKTAL